MNMTSLSPCLYTISSCTTHSFTNKKNNTNKSKHKKIHQNTNKPKSPFPKPTPIPLLTNPRTKLQALETIITKLEASTKNGIKINDPQIFASLLETCFNLQAFDHGTRVHQLIPQKLLRKNMGILSKLIRLYACDNNIETAHQLFDEMPNCKTSAFTWNSLISGYADQGLHEDALALYFQMVEEGFEPDGYTFPRVLKACGGIGLIQVGEEIHRHVIRFGFENDGFVKNALVDMYAKCGDIVKARKVFNNIKNKDLVSWNSILKGYIRHGLSVEAFHVFRDLIQVGCEPDPVTVSTILTSLSPFDTGEGTIKGGCEPERVTVSSPVLPSLSHFDTGMQIHGWVLRRGMEQNLSIANAFIVFYSRQGKLEKVRWMFECMQERDIVSWNSIISAHSKQPEALEYFDRMASSGVSPDGVTFVSLLSACAHLGMVKDAERFFAMMREKYGIAPVMEHYACMVNLYARAGLINEAYDVVVNGMEFEAGPTVWGPLLYGCCLHGNVDVGEIAAENLFELEPDNEHNFKLLMKIYRDAGHVEDAERVRVMIVERGLDF